MKLKLWMKWNVKTNLKATTHGHFRVVSDKLRCTCGRKSKIWMLYMKTLGSIPFKETKQRKVDNQRNYVSWLNWLQCKLCQTSLEMVRRGGEPLISPRDSAMLACWLGLAFSWSKSGTKECRRLPKSYPAHSQLWKLCEVVNFRNRSSLKIWVTRISGFRSFWLHISCWSAPLLKLQIVI